LLCDGRCRAGHELISLALGRERRRDMSSRRIFSKTLHAGEVSTPSLARETIELSLEPGVDGRARNDAAHRRGMLVLRVTSLMQYERATARPTHPRIASVRNLSDQQTVSSPSVRERNLHHLIIGLARPGN
jgi:hypothetical protein